MIQEILLKLSWPNWLFSIAVLILAAIAYLYYFRTLPPLSAGRRGLLFLVRALSLAILFFLILEPVLRLLYRQNEKPMVAVLLDNSASMKIRENGAARGDSVTYLAEHLAGLNRQDSLEIVPFTFDLATRPWRGDSLNFATDGSDFSETISAALDSLSGMNLQAIVLVSDGIYNRGANPYLAAQNSPAPIYTVLVGDTSLPRDVSLRRVQTNQITYVNKSLPVEVVFWQNGFDGKKALITISKNGQELARESVTFGKSGFEQKANLTLVAREAGDFNYTVKIQALEGEVTARNNQQNLRVQVLKSKIRVLVLSGSPSFDRHSLDFAGEQLKDYAFTFLTEKGPGEYYEMGFNEVKLDSQDLFILSGFPTRFSDAAQVRTLMQAVTNRRVPVFWFAARSADYRKLSAFEAMLPFQLTSRLTPLENQFAQLTAGGRLHPVTRLDENETANDLLWKALPPLEIYPQLKPRAGVQALLALDDREHVIPGAAGEKPLICYAYRQNEIKHLVFNGGNISSWQFQLQTDPAREQFFSRFLERAVRWLVNRDDIQQIQIRPLQPVYNVGEAVLFSGQVYDEFYQPVSDAEVIVTVASDTSRISDEMIAEGNGFYRQSFSGLPEGEFTYRVEASRKDKPIGTRSGKFTVKPFFLEFQQIPANHTLMKQLADVSGGTLYRPAEFLQNFPGKKLESRVQYASLEYFIWNYWYWLLLLIALLGTEWFLRKRWGLL